MKKRPALFSAIGLTFVLLAILGISLTVQAAPSGNVPARPQAVLLAEDFDYGTTAMSLTIASGGNWVNHSGASPYVGYTTTSLSMAGYGSSGVGGAATISTSGSEDVNRTFVAQTSGTVYFAALVNVSAAGGGTYFMHLKDTSTGFRARVFARDDTGFLRFGLDPSGSTGTYAADAYSYNTTYLLVTKQNLDTGATALYVLDAFSASEPVTPVVSFTTGTTVTVQAIALRQASGGPSAVIDGVRVGNTWEEAVGYVAPPEADLSVVKSGPATANAGEAITYTIDLSNTGTITAMLSILTDTLPAEVTFITYTTALPVSFSQPDAQTLVWDLGDIADGASGSITVQGTISASLSSSTVFTNTVTASTTATETNVANNTSEAATLIGAPDLVVIKDGPASVNAGDQVAYTLTYSNAGNLDAGGVVLVDQLPAAMTYVTDSLGTGVQVGNTITWTLGNLAVNASGSVVLTATADYVGDQVNTATISGSPTDSNPLDNVSVFTTTVLGSDPFVSKTGPTAAFSGELITYTIVYGNHGTVATDVTLTDTLPISFTTADIASDDSGLTPIDDTGTRSWTTTLAAGDRFTFTLALTVPTAIASNTLITNTIQIVGSGLGNDPIDDLSSASSTVYQIVPIATARAGSIGQVFVITGTVTVEPGVFTYNGQNRYMYIEDGTGGVLVYRTGGLDPVARGHVVRIVGSLDEYRAETEFVPASASDVLDLGAGTAVVPLVTNTGSIDESVEGELVQISGQITGKPASYRLQVDDGSGMVEAYRYYNLGQPADPNYIDFTPFGVGDYVRVVGVTRGYSESYGLTREVMPRGPIDIVEYPRVLSVSPAPNATDVAVTAPITAAFNLTMTNVSSSTFLLQGPGGAVAGTVAYDSATQTAIFTPTAALSTDTLYTATLKATLLADNGLTLMPAQDYVWSFQTRPSAPDLSLSTKANSVSGAVHSGQLVTYTITLDNTGDGSATVVVTDVLGSYYVVAEALDFTQPTTGTLTWTGVVTAGQSVNLQFVAQVKGPQDLPPGAQLLMNSAQINDGVHSPFNVDDPMPPTITIYGVYLPIIQR